ncbi:MAG: glycosyltransferase family 2 protein [Candidatus Buchananbacteria bacterium]|nr:glycosyltransferase family 2 protein [Candidatus Buchananbacteria bacterium]
MELSIIIVNWNVEKLLERCLESIYKYQGNLELEVIVVDNASKDRSLEMIKNNFPQVKLIVNQANRGFAAANNQGIEIASGRYLLLLNPDTEIKENSLHQSLEFFRTQEKVGVMGCKILNPDGSLQPSVRRFPTITAVILILSKIAKLLPNLPALKKYLAKDFDYRESQAVDQVMGAFFLIKRELIEQIGVLDERFFIWFEEVDFCYRAKKAGWQIWYYPDAEIIHYGGSSFKQALVVRKQWLFFQSALKYFVKHVFR